MSSASADPNGKQAKPAASTSHERARKNVCNCLVIDVLPPQRRFTELCRRCFTELCRRLSEQATLRDCCNIESTELSQLLVYDIGPCKYKKARIVVRGCYVRPDNPPLLAKTAPAAESEWCLSRNPPMDRWIRQPRGLQSSCWRAAALMAHHSVSSPLNQKG